jgi:hypothetical protein
MKNILAISLLLLTLNCFSQTSILDLEKIYLSYHKSNSNPDKIKLIDYLIKQYNVLAEMEKNSEPLLNSISESNISKLELIANKFLLNQDNFSKSNNEKPNDISEEEFNQFVFLNGQLNKNFEAFIRFLNNSKTEKNIDKLININSTYRNSLKELIHFFSKKH